MILDLLFPKTCFSCGALGKYLCLKCASKLRPIEQDVCPYCQKSSISGITHATCRRKGGINGLISIFEYNETFAKILKGVKYQYVTGALDSITNHIPERKISAISRFCNLYKDPQIVPIPLHKAKLRSRGFNQSQLIATFFARQVRSKIQNSVLVRQKETAPQAWTKSYKERQSNINDSFYVARDAVQSENSYPTFVLIDDVWTTGATIKEAAKTLSKIKNSTIFAVTLAQRVKKNY